MAKEEKNWIQEEASKIVSGVWNNNQDQSVFVTDKVAFMMRNLIKLLRKNYWGIFDEPNDPITGRKKIWIPVTESTVEGVVKNIDIDAKDINFRAKKSSAVALTGLVRSAVKRHLDDMFFGELLDETERQMCIDGTAVWKTIEKKDEDGKYSFEVYQVDLLNFAIDATSKNIQEASGVVERALITKEEFDEMDVSFNKEEVELTRIASPNDVDLDVSNQSNVDMVEMFEYWGLIPERLIDGKEKNKKLVNGRILCSGKKKFIVHEIEKLKGEYKPYEEVRYNKIAGRWYGKGPAEKIMMLQTWMNTIVNIRINRSYVSQLGLFKIRKGSGITAQQLSKLGENGAIELTNLADLEQLVMQEASQASYKDEDNILSWVERVTNSFQIVTGEQLPASTPATTAVIQNRNAQSAFTMVKEELGMFLQRWMTRHVLPIIKKNLTKDEIIQLTDSPEELRAIDDKIINGLAVKELRKIKESGKLVNEQQVLNAIDTARQKFEQMGDQRFFKIIEDLELTEYDTTVTITNEDIDKAVAVTNLISMLQTTAQLPQLGIDPADVARQIFDLMGLTPPKTMKQSRIDQQLGALQQNNPNFAKMIPNANAQSINQEANTLQNPVV